VASLRLLLSPVPVDDVEDDDSRVGLGGSSAKDRPLRNVGRRVDADARRAATAAVVCPTLAKRGDESGGEARALWFVDGVSETNP
jgi:hypothetical protein